MGVQTASVGQSISSLLSPDVPYDCWVPIHVPGWRPPARYKHAAEVVDDKLYIIGGSRNGRYLSDIQVFDLGTSTWSEAELSQKSGDVEIESHQSDGKLPAISGHSLIKWEGKLLIVAGFLKGFPNDVTVWSVDLTTYKCALVKTHGKVPIARGGQSVSLVGSKLIMFGGEDHKRRLLNDLHVLNLETMSWNAVETSKTSPAARFDHAAAVYEDRYLLVYGGSSYSTCFNDLHVLDLHTMEWSEIQIQGEDTSPRAGHAGATVGENWYIVGGGDNHSGALETLKLNMARLVWLETTRVAQRDPLASEGLSLCSATVGGETFLLAFGGYNGKYHHEVYVLKPKPSASMRPRILQSPAAAAAAASVTAAYALTSTAVQNLDAVATENKGAVQVQVETSAKDISVDISAITREKKLLETKLAKARDENSRLQNNLEELNGSFKELSAELQSVKCQLESESSRCLKLESLVADIRARLSSQQSLEHELESLRRQNDSLQEQQSVETRRQSSGVWQWVSGATA